MTDHPGPDGLDQPDDEAARRLRELLAREARAITPSADGLNRIREQIQAQRRPRRNWMRTLQVSAAAVATAAVAVVGVVVVEHQHSRGSTGPSTPLAGSPTASTPTPSPLVSPSSVVSSTSSTYPVWIYYVGTLKDPQQLLYRERVVRPRPVQNAFIKDAVTAMLTTPAQDPDYTSYWPAGTTLVSANIIGDTTAVVDLSSDAANGPAAHAAISVQQLLYTIKAAAPKIDALQLRIAGQVVTSLWGAPIDPTVTAQPSWQAWAHVWITNPAENASVASAITFGGEATVFEGTVSWELRENGGTLKRGAATASAGAPDRGLWTVTVEGLAPGTYSIRAWEVSAKDGSTTYLDDKIFTVR